MVRSPERYKQYFKITTGVLQGDTLAPFLFIICMDHILKNSLDENEKLGLTLTERKTRRYHAENIADIDYADDIALDSNSQTDANKMLLKFNLLPNISDYTLTLKNRIYK